MTIKSTQLFLWHFSRGLRCRAQEAFEAGDVDVFLGLASNDVSILIVHDNIGPLRARDIYEKTLVLAVTNGRVNNLTHYPYLKLLFGLADREKLRAAGDPIPPSDEKAEYLLYRGVGGNTRARRLRGYSWTSSFETGLWFAERARRFGLANPAVVEARVPEACVLLYTADRNEEEYICELPPHHPVRTVHMVDIDNVQS